MKRFALPYHLVAVVGLLALAAGSSAWTPAAVKENPLAQTPRSQPPPANAPIDARFPRVPAPAATAPALSEILAACEFLSDGDIPADTFQPPATAVYVAASGGNDAGPGTLAEPFATLDRAIEYANNTTATAMTIYLRGGVHLYKSIEEYQTINRGNLYIAPHPGEEATIRPYYYPGNPSSSGNERAFECNGPYDNLTFDDLTFEGWSVIFTLGSPLNNAPLRHVTIKNITASAFTRRNGEEGYARQFLETEYLSDDVYGEGKQIFDDPVGAHYQIEGLILSSVTLTGVDLAINVGDENDANVKGLRLTRFDVLNPSATAGDSAADAFAIVNSYKILIDHCRIENISDDGIDTKGYDVAVVNCSVVGAGRNAAKFWRNGELINSILYDVTEINDGAIIVKEGPFRMVNSVLLRHTVGYAGAFGYDTPVANRLEIVNSAFGEVKSFYVGTTDFRARHNRYFDILDDQILYSGQAEAADAAQLNALPNCSGNAVSTNQFSNPSGGDFSLVAGSEWINAGTSSGVTLPSFDYLGNPRVSGSAVDVGPIERQESGEATPTPGPGETPTATPLPGATSTATPLPGATSTPTPPSGEPIRDLILSFYQRVLGRDPESGAIDAWHQGYFNYAVSFNIDVRFIPREMARLFFLSDEYANRNRSDAEFITDCYQVFLDRDPNATELSNWTSGVWNRSEVMTVFSESEEFANRIAAMYPGQAGNPTRNFVTTMYIGLLDRLVDQSGLVYAAGLFDAANAQGGVASVRAQAKQMAREVIASAEFTGKQPTTADYVTRFYRAFLGRFPNGTEIAYWSDELDSGRRTTDALIDLFADSAEFAARLNEYFGA
jgi:hypothetical protein